MNIGIKKIAQEIFIKFPFLSTIPFVNRKHIRGHGNLVKNEGKLMYKTKITINGSNNRIFFIAGGRLEKVIL